MAYFGPGVPNNVNLTPTAMLVFTPNPSANSTVRIVNQGSSTVYVGGANVSANSGIPVAPLARIELPVMNTSLYAAGSYGPSTASSTTLAAATTAATTAITTAASVPTGSTLLIGNGSGTEFATVTVGGTTVGTSPLLYDHASGAAVKYVNPVIGLLQVQGGTSGIA
jgi:hypothetical protein